MKILILVFSILLICRENVSAKSTISETRFKSAIDQLSNSIESTFSKNKNFDELSEAEQAELFSAAGVRVKAFNLQSLGRMYLGSDSKDLRKFAKEIHDATKLLEDKLGSVDMYKNVDKQEDRDKAAKKLMKLFESAKWTDGHEAGEIFTNWLSKMSVIKWPSEKDDREYIIKSVMEQLNTVNQTEYDMDYLQKGMHELRRELRWISLYVIASGGLIQKANSDEFACDRKSLPFKKFADPKYTTLKSQPDYPGVCYISECVYDEIVGAVGIFGLLKDKAEKIVEHDVRLLKSDLNPDETKIDSKKYYKLLSETQILDSAHDQLQNCLN